MSKLLTDRSKHLCSACITAYIITVCAHLCVIHHFLGAVIGFITLNQQMAVNDSNADFRVQQVIKMKVSRSEQWLLCNATAIISERMFFNVKNGTVGSGG